MLKLSKSRDHTAVIYTQLCTRGYNTRSCYNREWPGHLIITSWLFSDPRMTKEHLAGSLFLPYVNNEKGEDEEKQRKKDNFTALRKLILIGGKVKEAKYFYFLPQNVGKCSLNFIYVLLCDKRH